MITTLSFEPVRNFLTTQLHLNYPYSEEELEQAIDCVIRDYLMLLVRPDTSYGEMYEELNRSLCDIGYPTYKLSSLHEQVHTLMVNILTNPWTEHAQQLRYLGTHRNGRFIVEITP
jgi:hypothetical protein